MLIIDPPSGWRYGFPKPFTNPEGLPVNEWLIKNGYPSNLVDGWRDKEVPCRFWEDNE